MFSYTNQSVEKILSNEPRSRSNDQYLIMRVWERNGLRLTEEQQKLFLSGTLPSPETIRRTRQKLQENGKYKASNEVEIYRQHKANETRQVIAKDRPVDLNKLF